MKKGIWVFRKVFSREWGFILNFVEEVDGGCFINYNRLYIDYYWLVFLYFVYIYYLIICCYNEGCGLVIFFFFGEIFLKLEIFNFEIILGFEDKCVYFKEMGLIIGFMWDFSFCVVILFNVLSLGCICYEFYYFLIFFWESVVNLVVKFVVFLFSCCLLCYMFKIINSLEWLRSLFF